MTRPRRVFASSRARTQVLGFLLAALLATAFATFVVRRYLPVLTDAGALRAWVAGYGALAPAVFVGLQAGQVVVAPVPGQLMGLVSGYLFGTAAGTAISLAGATAGTAIAVWLARRFGRPYVERVVDPDTLAAFDGFVERRGLFAVFLVFLLPGLPDDAVCFLVGVTRLPIGAVLAVSVVGRFPGYLLVNYAGASLAESRPVEAAVVLVALALLALVVYARRDALTGAPTR